LPGGAGRPGAPPGSGMAGPALGGGGRFGGGGRRGGPGPPAFLGGSAGVGESFSPGRGARAGGESPREAAPEASLPKAAHESELNAVGVGKALELADPKPDELKVGKT